jgi:catechol 2,3-dioxygenase-like lactoylglutathione lyase family enzyme
MPRSPSAPEFAGITRQGTDDPRSSTKTFSEYHNLDYIFNYHSSENHIEPPGVFPHTSAMIKSIKFASIPVRNQDASLDFYTKKLGFIVLTDQPFNDKQRWIELGIPGAQTGVVLFTPDGHEDRIGSFSGVSFLCDDIEQTYELFKSRGVEFAGPPKAESWGTFVILKDLDGNQFVMSAR